MGKKSEATKTKFELLPKSRDPSYKRIHGNYPAKKYKKGTPCVTRLEFEFVGSDTRYIDIAAALSAINRRLYRQGCYYYVNSVELYDNATTVIDLHTIPDTWVTRAAYRRAKGVWDGMNDFAMRNIGNIVPKYHDFKVFMSNNHRNEGTTMPALYGINQQEYLMNPDEWQYSLFVSADDDGDGNIGANQNADDFFAHMIGPNAGTSDNWGSIGLIRSYAVTRVRDNASTPVVDAGLVGDPLYNLMDFSSEEQLNEIAQYLDEHNDQTPYDHDVYPGALADNMQHVVRLTTTPESGRVTQGAGFCAPLGLICVDPAPFPDGVPSDNRFRIVLNLAVGTYNGVYAERM